MVKRTTYEVSRFVNGSRQFRDAKTGKMLGAIGYEDGRFSYFDATGSGSVKEIPFSKIISREGQKPSMRRMKKLFSFLYR